MCRCSHRNVQLLGAAFWATGAIMTSFMCVNNTFVLSAKADDAAGKDWFWPWVAIAAGVLEFLLFFGRFVFIPQAIEEINRIRALEHPHAGQFYHKWRLLALIVFIPCLVMINKHTEQYYVADLIFGGSVVPVSLGLWAGTFILLSHLNKEIDQNATYDHHLLNEA